MIAYCSFGANTATIVDRTGDPAPDGHDTLLRHLVFLRRRPEVPVAEFRRFVSDDLAPAYAWSLDVLKVRRHLFEEVEVTLDHPGVQMSKPLERQNQAAVEVVADDAALTRLVSSPAWTGTADAVAARCEAMHAARVERCITTKFLGEITLAGVRGVAVADVIKRVSARSQLEADVSELFLPGPMSLRV